MRNLRWRLHKLEHLPHSQAPPNRLEQVKTLALQHLSNEDLAVMIVMATDLKAGLIRPISEKESAVLATQNAALETEALRMGFGSFAEAEHIGSSRQKSAVSMRLLGTNPRLSPKSR